MSDEDRVSPTEGVEEAAVETERLTRYRYVGEGEIETVQPSARWRPGQVREFPKDTPVALHHELFRRVDRGRDVALRPPEGYRLSDTEVVGADGRARTERDSALGFPEGDVTEGGANA